MDKFIIKPVGIVVNDFNEPTGYNEIKKKPSTIIIYKEYSEALINIGECDYLDIVFYFHKSIDFELSGKIHSGKMRGVFASRSPRRPNSIGITTVKLIQTDKEKLVVEGLDAINNTPVIDIKCCDTSLFAAESDSNEIHNSILKSNPRIEVWNNIEENKTEALLLKSGQMHGHFCPGLAMGIMAATYAMKELKGGFADMEDLFAITETKNCFSDGIQFVTGCTFGNNRLIFKDLGKTAFTLTTKDGKGLRICSKHESRDVIQENFPDSLSYYTKVVTEKDNTPQLVLKYNKASLERAFGTLSIPFDKLFSVMHTQTKISCFEHDHKDIKCTGCGESVLISRTITKGDKTFCINCASEGFNMMAGKGITIHSE